MTASDLTVGPARRGVLASAVGAASAADERTRMAAPPSAAFSDGTSLITSRRLVSAVSPHVVHVPPWSGLAGMSWYAIGHAPNAAP